MTTGLQIAEAGLGEVFANHANMANTLMTRAGQLIEQAIGLQSNPLYKGSTTIAIHSGAQNGDVAARFTYQVNSAYQHGYETRKIYEGLEDRISKDGLTRANMKAEVKVITGEAQLNAARALDKGGDIEVNKVVDAEIITIEEPTPTTAIARPRRYRALPVK